MSQYKILYIISSLKRCGPVNQLYGIIKHLDRIQFEPMVLTLFKESDDSRITDFHNLNIKTYCLNVNKKNSFYKSKQLIKDIVNEISPDLIHSHGFRPDLYVHKYLNKYKHCNTIHNYPYEDYPMAYGKFIGNIMAYKHINIFSKMDYPIACSYTIKNKLKKHLNKNIHAIQNGIDSNKFCPVDKETKLKLRKELNLNTNKKVFIYSGVLSSRKDPITIIDAFNKANISKESELILVGDGPLRKVCEDRAKEGIHIMGKVDNVVDFLRASDIFVSSSKAEGLPMAVLEALGVGLPVILSNIPSHKELIEVNKNIGDEYDLKNSSELISCLKTYSTTNLSTKGFEARRTVEYNFSAKIMSKSYEEVYVNILSRYN